MEDNEIFNPQSGERIAPKRPKKFWKDWRFYVYTIIALMLGIVSISSMVTACAAINAGVGSGESSSLDVSNVKRAQITTEEGEYTGYTFSMPLSFPSDSATINYKIYSLNSVANFNFTLYRSSSVSCTAGRSPLSTAYNALYTEMSNLVTGANQVYFLFASGNTDVWGSNSQTHSVYFSFYRSASNNAVVSGIAKSFVATNFSPLGAFSMDDGNMINWDAYNPIIMDYGKVGFWFQTWSQIEPEEIVFQDVISYYKELGYSDGYDDGEAAGNSAGYSSGYSDGYTEGYDAGETHAYETLQTGIAFDSYGMYANATISLVADRVEGSYYYMDLFDYVTESYVDRSVYVLWTQSANSTYIGYVMDVNNSDSSGATYQIGRFSGASSLSSVVFTAEMDRNLWEGAYITTFHGHAEAVNNAFWFTGGSYAASQQIYQDGYDQGYDAGQNAGYSNGYDAGIDVGYAQGMNAADPESLTNTLVAVFQQPFNQIYRFFNFNILGLNVLGIVSGLISVLVVIKVFRKLYK